MAPSTPSPTHPASAPDILGVVPNITASTAPSPHPLYPSPPPASSPPVIYLPLSSGASSDPASASGMPSAHGIDYSAPSRTTITISIVVAVVVGLALVALAFISFRVCRRKKQADKGANLFRSSTFGMRPPPGFGVLDSAATSKEALPHYRLGREMVDLPNRPASAYSGASTPPIPQGYESPKLPPMPFQSYGPPRAAPAPPTLTWTRSSSSGLPARSGRADSPSAQPLIAPVFSSSPERITIRTPPAGARVAPEPQSNDSLSSFASASTPSVISTPGTQTSQDSVPTPPTSPFDRTLGGGSGGGGKPKLSIVTSPSVAHAMSVAPLRIPPPAAQPRVKPDFARLLFAAGLQTSPSAPEPMSPAEEAEEDVFAAPVSPLQASRSTPVPRVVPLALPGRVPSIVVTSPKLQWEDEEGEEAEEDGRRFSQRSDFSAEFDDEEEGGLYTDEDGFEEEGPFDSPIFDDDDDEEEDIATHHRAITLALHASPTLSLTLAQQPHPRSFPSTVSFPTTLASVSPLTPLHIQSPPSVSVGRGPSPAEFPQSPLESEIDEEEVFGPLPLRKGSGPSPLGNGLGLGIYGQGQGAGGQAAAAAAGGRGVGGKGAKGREMGEKEFGLPMPTITVTDYTEWFDM